MALYRDEAVVLRTVKLGEADRIVTMLTESHGKVRAVAKGVRRTKSRFGGRLEPFMRVDVLIAQGRSLDVISQAESLSAYAGAICADYGVYAAANAVVETANMVVSAEHEPSREQYRLLRGALHALAAHAHDADMIGDSYVMRALALAGWTPRLRACVACGRLLPEPRGDTRRDTASPTGSWHRDAWYVSASAGGSMCATDHISGSRRMSVADIWQLDALVDGRWASLDGVAMSAAVRELVEDWGAYYLERPIRSLRLLDS